MSTALEYKTEDLYDLLDATGVTLVVSNGKVMFGTETFVEQISGISYKLTVVCIGTKEPFLIFHVSGDLYMLVYSSLDDPEVIEVRLLDKKNEPDLKVLSESKPFHSQKMVEEVIDKMASATVSHYVKEVGKDWKQQ